MCFLFPFDRVLSVVDILHSKSAIPCLHIEELTPALKQEESCRRRDHKTMLSSCSKLLASKFCCLILLFSIHQLEGDIDPDDFQSVKSQVADNAVSAHNRSNMGNRRRRVCAYPCRWSSGHCVVLPYETTTSTRANIFCS